jgi:cell surface protein SprA
LIKGRPIIICFNNVRFARLMLTGFDQTSTLRFGTMDLVRSDWRKYPKNCQLMFLRSEGTGKKILLEVGSVNIEENALINLHMYCLRELTDRF